MMDKTLEIWMDSLQAQAKELEAARKLIEVLRHERVYKNPVVKEALAAYDKIKRDQDAGS